MTYLLPLPAPDKPASLLPGSMWSMLLRRAFCTCFLSLKCSSPTTCMNCFLISFRLSAFPHFLISMNNHLLPLGSKSAFIASGLHIIISLFQWNLPVKYFPSSRQLSVKRGQQSTEEKWKGVLLPSSGVFCHLPPDACMLPGSVVLYEKADSFHSACSVLTAPAGGQ